MKNITLSIDEDVLREVRKYAAERETTVNALVRDHLTRLARQRREGAKARQELARLSDKSTWDPGPWKWNREELYDRPSLRRHERPGVRGVARAGGQGKKASSK